MASGTPCHDSPGLPPLKSHQVSEHRGRGGTELRTCMLPPTAVNFRHKWGPMVVSGVLPFGTRTRAHSSNYRLTCVFPQAGAAPHTSLPPHLPSEESPAEESPAHVAGEGPPPPQRARSLVSPTYLTPPVKSRDHRQGQPRDAATPGPSSVSLALSGGVQGWAHPPSVAPAEFLGDCSLPPAHLSVR